MIVELGQFAALCVLIAAVLKLIDWLMLDDQKLRLGEELSRRLAERHISLAFVAKTPILAFNRILSAALFSPVTRKTSLRRAASVSSLLIATCLVSAGVLTNTTLGFEESPSDSYRQEIKIFETLAVEENRLSELTDEQQQEMSQYRQDMMHILETAKHPFARWASIIFVTVLTIIISVYFTIFSLSLTAKTTKAIVTTDQPLLLFGAILLNGFGSLIVFIVELVFLSIASSTLLLFLFSFAGILFELGPMWGLAGFSGYGVFAWITAPIWLKALATASIIPFLLMAVAIALTAIIFLIRRPLSSFSGLLLKRVATHRDGPIAFLATSFFCLAVAITAATSLIN